MYRSLALLALCSAVLSFVVLAPVSTGPGVSLRESEAISMLRQGFDLRTRHPQAAIRILKQVVAYDPYLEADFPFEKIHLVAFEELAFAYYYTGDYANALPYLEMGVAYNEKHRPNSTSVLLTLIDDCRRHLGLPGYLTRRPQAASLVSLSE